LPPRVKGFGRAATHAIWAEQVAERKTALSAQTELRPGDVAAATPEKILAHVIESLEDDKAEDLVVFDLEGKSSLADQMIIASGRSARHVSALADNVMQTIKDTAGRRAKVEGLQTGDWVLIDTGDLIVHLFRPEVRSFYNLERIWGPHEGPSEAA